MRDITLTLKSNLEANLRRTIKPGEVITEWLVRWAAMLASRYLVGKDGRTGFE